VVVTPLWKGSEADREERRIMRIIHKGAVVLALFLAIILGLPSSQGELALARTQDRPNVLFIMTDDLDVRAYERFMPRTNRLIEERGVKFKNATYSMSVCCPSRASIQRGQYTHNTFVWKNSPPRGGFETFRSRDLDKDTYATRMNRAGYRTAYFGKYMNGYETPDGGPTRYVVPGWDYWMAATPGPNSDAFNLNGQIYHPEGEDPYHDRVIADRAVWWMERATDPERDQRPFMATISFHAPHTPMEHPESYDDLFRSVKLPRPPSFNEKDRSDKPQWIRALDPISDAERRELAKNYRDRLRSIEFVDRRIAGVIEMLTRRSELQNTYVVFYSDNGYHMGEHRLPAHAQGSKAQPYIEDVRFPIVMRGPGIPQNTVNTEMVQNVDLRPTFEDIANATPTLYADGTSLLPAADLGAPFPRKFALAERLGDGQRQRTPWKGLHSATVAYHLWGTGEEEFYDLRLDPYQLRSDPSDPRAALMRAELKRMARCDAVECYSTP
jgi:arylsulfatase A-like enzyme